MLSAPVVSEDNTRDEPSLWRVSRRSGRGYRFVGTEFSIAGCPCLSLVETYSEPSSPKGCTEVRGGGWSVQQIARKVTSMRIARKLQNLVMVEVSE